MGQDVQQDWAISIGAMLALMAAFELAWGRAGSMEEKDEVVTCAAYAVIAFCGSLRGNEVFLVDLAGLRRYLRKLGGGRTLSWYHYWVGTRESNIPDITWLPWQLEQTRAWRLRSGYRD
jgi:hypothetical protein